MLTTTTPISRLQPADAAPSASASIMPHRYGRTANRMPHRYGRTANRMPHRYGRTA